MLVLSPNAPAHRRRANDVRLSTDARSRRSVQPACSAILLSYSLLSHAHLAQHWINTPEIPKPRSKPRRQPGKYEIAHSSNKALGTVGQKQLGENPIHQEQIRQKKREQQKLQRSRSGRRTKRLRSEDSHQPHAPDRGWKQSAEPHTFFRMCQNGHVLAIAERPS